jgi:hypothetical protein
MLQLAMRAGTTEGIRVTTIRLSVTGAGDESATVTSADLYIDADGDGRYTLGTDQVFQTGVTFPVDEGTATFSGTPVIIPPSGVVYFLLTFDLAAGAGDDLQAYLDVNGDVTAAGAATSTPVTPLGAPVLGGVKTATTAGNPGSLEIRSGMNSPTNQTVVPGTSQVPMVQLILRTGSVEGVNITSADFTASGTGNDASEVVSVRLVRDNNGDGAYDAGDTLLGSGTYVADDGSVSFGGLSEAIPAGSQVSWLVLQDFAAGAGVGTFRTGVLLATDVAAAGTVSAASLAASGVPINGCTITVQPVAVTGGGEPTSFVGSCGGPGVGGLPLLPVMILGIFLWFRRRSRVPA